MHAPSSGDIWLFGEFRLNRRTGVLFRRDERGVFAPLPMGSRPLDILGVLVERAGELVPRAEIISAVWAGTAVEDSNLDVQIAALRRVLDGETHGRELYPDHSRAWLSLYRTGDAGRSRFRDSVTKYRVCAAGEAVIGAIIGAREALRDKRVLSTMQSAILESMFR